ncbi:MAG TPA: tRNA (N(6)-L-threonylcarbamoyladenosine(37)-C(2))-methylthiotransferase MtaB [Candidatus Acidoferrum sp.]|nr:tRNA (N(6)-L-threonylcarbamoyladenosine(37)-C(2))-methylthiotransferase MtaB [Candidatus Acidoferrum sp.]
MSTFFIQQFGCRATQADGAALERQLLDLGCTPAPDPLSASFIVLNTCTVTAAADAQARDAIRKFHAQNPDARLIVTGCYAQRAPEELAALPGVSHVVGNSHKPQIPSLIAAARDVIPSSALFPDSALPFHSFLPEPQPASSAQILIGDIFAHTKLLSAPLLGGEVGHTRPTLKIQDGCNLRCSYCVIPFVRGKSRSLPPDSVIREIQSLASPHSPNPAREIVLSGINLGSYGRDLSPGITLLSLLRRILDETSLDRLRISSIEPQDVTQDFVALFASTDRLAQHFHMPLQSGSDRILAAMHRRYRASHYARRVELIRDLLPHAAIGADVICGFPGESEADFAATLDFIQRLPFTYLHVFSFSARPGTPAASLPGQVPAPLVKRRARELRALSESKSAAFRRSQLGRILRVLTLHRSAHDGLAGVTPALSSNYLEVQIPGIFTSNQWLETEIGQLEGNCLCGQLVGQFHPTLSESPALRA